MTKPSQATLLVALAQTEGIELWHDADGRAFVTIPRNDHREHHRLRSTTVRTWISSLAYRQLGISPGSEAMQTALTTLEGIAIHDGQDHEVFARIAGFNGNIYFDLANNQWQAIEVSPAGWRIVQEAPVRFRRAPGMLALPVPTPGGRLEQIRPLINVRDADWPLFAGWLVQAARDQGPYPVLAVYGEHGSAKSTGARLLRSIIDPNKAPLRSPPKELRDLAIAASNGWVVALDNLSSIPQWLSDALCVLSTGGGFATRTLYTDDEESIFSFKRPVIINGITEVAERPDLIDRCIPVLLEVISDDRRLTEEEIGRAFAAAHPTILGALFDAVSLALKRLPETSVSRKSRMADFITWVTAAEPALCAPTGDFARAYARARSEAIEANIDTSSLGQWVMALAAKGGYRGTATELFDVADEKLRRASDWPKNARSLSGELKRLAPALRAVDVHVEFTKESTRAGRRLIIIGPLEQAGESASDASEASESRSSGNESSDADPRLRTIQPPLSDDGVADAQVPSDASDDSDASSAPYSSPKACPICSRSDLCESCKLDEDSAETCSLPGCYRTVYLYDPEGHPRCEQHALAAVRR